MRWVFDLAATGQTVTDTLVDQRWDPIVDRIVDRREVLASDLAEGRALLRQLRSEWRVEQSQRGSG